MGQTTGPEVLEASILRIRGGDGRPVGTGFLVAPHLALTCAHVVSAALGRHDGDPAPSADTAIEVDLPLGPDPESAPAAAYVEYWEPAHPRGGGDIAVLRLPSPPAGGAPVRMAEARDVWSHPVRAFGFPAGRDQGVWHAGRLRARQASGLVQFEQAAPEGYPISRGFSGGPVWDDELSAVIGIVAVAEPRAPRAAFLIPTERIVAAFAVLGEFARPQSPFRGLAAFQETDAGVFHGRSAESAELAAVVRAKPVVTVVGPSGCGKSSLVLAGVVPRLRASGYAVVVLRPARTGSLVYALAAELTALMRPELAGTERLREIRALERELAEHGLTGAVDDVLRRSGAHSLLVIVDQLEEALADDAPDLGSAVRLLFAEGRPNRLRVLATLRADFLDAALNHPGLGAVLGEEIHVLAPLLGSRLREVVTVPIDAIAAVSYEPGLVDRLLSDAAEAPGILPLLGFTLARLWERQSQGRLTFAAYENLGGVKGALANQAEHSWQECVREGTEAVARRLFVQLVRVPMGGTAATRQVVARGELGPHQWEIARTLAEHRLLVLDRDVSGRDTVELAHEALIGCWPRLRGWVEEDRDFLVWRENLRHDMARWEAAGRPRGRLPDAVALEASRRWLDSRGPDVGAGERHYLRQGWARLRGTVRRRRAVVTAGFALMTVMVVLVSLFVYQTGVSAQRKAEAESRSLAAVSADLQVQDPGMSILLAIAAYATSPTTQARNELLQRYATYGTADRVLSGVPGEINDVAASRDGRVVVAVTTLGRATAFIQDDSGRTHREQLPLTTNALYPMVTADGSRVGYTATGGSVVWHDVQRSGGHLLGPAHTAPGALDQTDDKGFGSMSHVAALAADGRRAAAVSKKQIMVWDLGTATGGRFVKAPSWLESVDAVWFGPTSDTLLVRGTIRVLSSHDDLHKPHGEVLAVDLRTGRTTVVAEHVSDAQVSGDGRAVVSCTAPETDLTPSSRRHPTYSRVPVTENPTDSAHGRASYVPQTQNVTDCEAYGTDWTGQSVVVNNWSDGLVQLDLDRRTASVPGIGHDELGALPVAVVERDHRATAMLAVGYEVRFLPLPATAVISVRQEALLLHGGQTMIAVEDGGQWLRTRSTADPMKVLAEVRRSYATGPTDSLDPFVINARESLVADRIAADKIGVFALPSLRKVRELSPMRAEGPQAQDRQFFFDRDGRLVTFSGRWAEVWDPVTGDRRSTVDLSALGMRRRDGDFLGIRLARYPLSGHVLVLGVGDQARVVDLRTGQEKKDLRLDLGPDADAAFFDSSGRYLAVLRRGSTPEVWRTRPPKNLLGPLPAIGASPGGAGYVVGFLHGDGRFLVADSGKARIYRVGDRSFEESYDFGTATRFLDSTSDGRTLLVSRHHFDDDRSDVPALLRLDPSLWRAKLCSVIDQRDLTQTERQSVPAALPPGPVCGS